MNDLMNIPVIINNFNRLTILRKLADGLSSLGYTNIHIIDNNSTYPKLLEYYQNDCPYTVKRCGVNHGHLSIYNSEYIIQFIEKWPYIAYTDPDLELNPNTPKNFIEILIKAAEIN